jgi:hypothetical protein
MFLIRKTKVVVATTNPTARMMHPYSGALSDILQPTDPLPKLKELPMRLQLNVVKRRYAQFLRAFSRGIDLKQIGSKMFAEPRKLSHREPLPPHPR